LNLKDSSIYAELQLTGMTDFGQTYLTWVPVFLSEIIMFHEQIPIVIDTVIIASLVNSDSWWHACGNAKSRAPHWRKLVVRYHWFGMTSSPLKKGRKHHEQDGVSDCRILYRNLWSGHDQRLERIAKAIQTNYHPISEHIEFSNMGYEVVPLIWCRKETWKDFKSMDDSGMVANPWKTATVYSKMSGFLRCFLSGTFDFLFFYFIFFFFLISRFRFETNLSW
jgi:hypothetical protein